MLTLYGHKLSSFCQKVIVALYETATPFAFETVDLGDAASRQRFEALWPIGKMPVLHDAARGETVPESSVIIEYLDTHYPGAVPLLPRSPDEAWRARLVERFFDLHVQGPMQAIVGDRLRPAESRDRYGVEQASRRLKTALDVAEQRFVGERWALGEGFGVADCAAAPALFYADKVLPFAASHPRTWAYFERLKARPSYARALAEAEPYLHLFPR